MSSPTASRPLLLAAYTRQLHRTKNSTASSNCLRQTDRLDRWLAGITAPEHTTPPGKPRKGQCPPRQDVCSVGLGSTLGANSQRGRTPNSRRELPVKLQAHPHGALPPTRTEGNLDGSGGLPGRRASCPWPHSTPAPSGASTGRPVPQLLSWGRALEQLPA